MMIARFLTAGTMLFAVSLAAAENLPAETENQTTAAENLPAETEKQTTATENQSAETENEAAETENESVETEKQEIPAKPAPPPLYEPIHNTNLNPALFEDQVRASELIEQREALILKIVAERQRILQTDIQAKRLHAEIMANYKKLAVIMENKRVIRDLDRELRHLDTKIKKLPLKTTPEEPEQDSDSDPDSETAPQQ